MGVITRCHYPAEPGRLMTKFYLKFATMKTIVDCAPGSAIEGLLQVLARADELSCKLSTQKLWMLYHIYHF